MSKKALFIVNLGSPNSTEVSDVRAYLNQFLMDEDVIDTPWILRFPLVRWLIVPSRAPKTAKAYAKIFTRRGSPLKFHTSDFVNRLREHYRRKVVLKNNENGNVTSYTAITFAMRYAQPSILNALIDLRTKNVSEIHLVPMYPQFAKSSTTSVVKEVTRCLKRMNWQGVKVIELKDFFQEPEFLESFQSQIQKSIDSFQPDHLLLSYHGLPEAHVKETSPNHCFKSENCCDKVSEENRYCYRAQCFATTRGIVQGLRNAPSYSISFQSRLGRKEWIKPYTDLEISELVKQGKKRVLVTCPAFVADCLETLEEVGIRLKEDFIKLGGEDLKLVPSLNSEEVWIPNFAKMVSRLFQ